MISSDPSPYDVIIAGAGPTGLLLGCELALAGCRVLILEQAVDRPAPFKQAPFGIRGLSVPTVEAFDRRGLLSKLRQATATASIEGPAHQAQRRGNGHFAGIDFFYDEIDESTWPFRLPEPIEVFASDMATIERVLASRAEALGAVIRRGDAVAAVEQTERGVTVDAGVRLYEGKWLVGCDGARSAVRKLAGLGFNGTEPEFTGYSLKATLADPAMLSPGRNLAPGGVYIYAPPDTFWVAEFDGGRAHRAEPITRAHVEAMLRRVSGVDIDIASLDLATTWTDRSFIADTYRNGRVLVAGDAAHIHSPLGGQGLNLGLGDAINLGWKLAAVVRGEASLALLDSYERERKPIAAHVLERSRAQVALLRPDPGARALEAIVAALIETPSGMAYFAERVSGVGLRYDVAEQHPLAGRSVPDFVFSDGTRMNDYLRSGRAVMLDFSRDSALERLGAQCSERVSYVARSSRNSLGLNAALIRPDGVIAWATDAGADIDRVRDVMLNQLSR